MVSVITSVYNCEKYLDEMIQSVLLQTYDDWEMIIIDDASTDSTWNIISRYNDKRIIKIRNEVNQGLTVNLNKAIELSRGEYLLRIDGDDVAYSRRIERQVDFMQRHQDVALSGCWVKVFGEKTNIWRSNVDYERLKIHLLFGAVMYHPTFIIRKSMLEKHNIKYDETLRYAQDYNLEYRISKYEKIANIPEVLMKYRAHGSQISAIKNKSQLECANKTRRMILREMDIALSDHEMLYWQNFGLLTGHKMGDVEREKIEHIMQAIIDKNKELLKYDHVLLQSILNNRFQCYKRRCGYFDERKANAKPQIAQGRYYALFLMMYYWNKLKKENKNIANYFHNNNIKNIAIYGMGYVGQLLVDELDKTDIEVAYGIDIDIFNNFSNKKMILYTPDEVLPEVDVIVVTPIDSFEEIKNMMVGYTLISIEDIVYEVAQY